MSASYSHGGRRKSAQNYCVSLLDLIPGLKIYGYTKGEVSNEERSRTGEIDGIEWHSLRYATSMAESNNRKIIVSSKLMHTLWSVTILQIHTSAEIGIGLFHSKKQPLAWLLRSVGSSIDQRVLVLLSGLGKMTMVSLIQNAFNNLLYSPQSPINIISVT